MKITCKLAHALIKSQNKEMRLYWTKSPLTITFCCFLTFHYISWKFYFHLIVSFFAFISIYFFLYKGK